ncbi:peptidoglycan DD-metalloendopeptidase family protein, partial [Enterococcus faecium]|uniref:peptidoglycan DD-metalloendopeptidase family protein n=1 Tax=Enterococcus faecium TaxID=1352 RepID=UPI0019145068
KAQAQPTVQEESKTYHQAPTSPIQELVPSSKQDNEGNIHFEKNESVESFIRKIGESARKVGQENDLYASVMIAQAILESASGQSQLAQAPNYNLFGIKGTHNGKGVSFATQEDLGNGTLYTTQATFRQYENYEDSLNDYAQLLKEGLTGNSQFYSGVWKTNAKTYQEATKFLTGRYATDTKYNQKLNGLIETYHLTDYDKEVAGPQLSKEGYIVPVKNYTISSSFGTRGGEFHRGIDLAAAQGEPIYASKAGTVVKAEFHPSWGNYVAIEHEDGTTALYAHQQEYQVKMGDKVKQGQIIGYVGSTGNSTGSHLHFELCLDHSLNQSQLVDPETVLF